MLRSRFPLPVATAALCCFVVISALLLFSKLGKRIWLPISILLLSHGLHTVRRNRDWQDEEALFKSALKVSGAAVKDRFAFVPRCASTVGKEQTKIYCLMNNAKNVTCASA